MAKDLRLKTKFLWLPKKDNNKWYWLRKVNIVEKLVIYRVTEYPLIPLLFGGPFRYTIRSWEFLGIADESNAIEIFVPDKDCP